MSRQWAQEFLDEGKMKELLRVGWEYNLHRGEHAAGYMRFDTESNKLETFRAPGSALELLKRFEKRTIPVGNIMAMHTRAATNGDPEDNSNNHPVGWDGVWVTHNGTITNHKKIKELTISASKEDGIEDAVPDVDSVAISMVLSGFDPWNLEEIARALGDLEGGYAFHAVWEEHPNVSLLVRGKSSPLIMRYHPHGGFVYASEEDATWQMIDAMGLNPNDENWVVRRFDEYTAMVIIEGTPVEFVNFKKQSWNDRCSEIVRRFVPRKDDARDTVYVANKKSDWAPENENLSLNMVDPERIELVYTREQGFADDKKTLPLSPSDIFAKLSEADNVYWVKGARQYHAFYGNTELVLSEHGSLRDVYHHDVVRDDQRWQRIKVDPEKLDVSDNWEEFSRKHTTLIVNPVKSDMPPAYKTNRARFTGRPLPVQTRNTSGGSQQRIFSDDDTDDPTYGGDAAVAEIGEVVDYENVWKLPQNRHDVNLTFFKDLTCSRHTLLYTQHTRPLECEDTLIAAFAVYSCISELDVWGLLVGGATVKTVRQGDPNCNHIWEVYYRSVETIGDVSLSIPMGDRCAKSCGAKRIVTGLPEWIVQKEERDKKLYRRTPNLQGQGA